MMPPPAAEGYRWSLRLPYGATAPLVVAPSFACRWYAKLKARRRDGWSRYL